jgi:uncharacterized cupin superfamily protein
MANAFEPSWDDEQDRPPFSWRRARLGRQAGSDRLGASLFELAPGSSSFPLHIHHANEELLVVISGQPTLRTLDGERQLEEGEVVAFPSGRTGAHRIDNRGEQPVRVLIVSTMIAPEVNEFPDSGKVWARTFPPGAPQPEEAVDILVRPGDERADYLDGEA